MTGVSTGWPSGAGAGVPDVDEVVDALAVGGRNEGDGSFPVAHPATVSATAQTAVTEKRRCIRRFNHAGLPTGDPIVVAMTASARERAALVETLKKAGPDAPTLCAGWKTRDLAAHLVMRERRPDAAAGILVPALAGYTARVQQRLATSTGWNELVALVASGPPLYSPFKLLDPLLNTAEMFIHHEDIRRAGDQWEPRELDGATVAALRRAVPMMSRMTLGQAPVRALLRDLDGATVAAVGRGPQVVVAGAAPELLFFVSGRDAARVELTGDTDTVAALRRARSGL